MYLTFSHMEVEARKLNFYIKNNSLNSASQVLRNFRFHLQKFTILYFVLVFYVLNHSDKRVTKAFIVIVSPFLTILSAKLDLQMLHLLDDLVPI